MSSLVLTSTATKDSDLLVPDGAEADAAILRFDSSTGLKPGASAMANVPVAEDVDGSHHLRVNSRHGIVDVMWGGLPPLDFETVAERAAELDAGVSLRPSHPSPRS